LNLEGNRHKYQLGKEDCVKRYEYFDLTHPSFEVPHAFSVAHPDVEQVGDGSIGREADIEREGDMVIVID
jgi:hypothetical protein